jgi:inner membrane protein
MFVGLFTHPILDAFTTWGTQLFWPFDLRLAFQNIFVIDPLYTLPFLVLLIMAMRQKRQSPKRAQYNMLGLGLSTSYLALSLVLKAVAYYNIKGNLDAQGIDYEEIDIRPAPLNTILWSANIDVGDAYLIGNYSFFDESPMVFNSYPKDHHLLGQLAKNEKIARLKKITEGWFTVEEKDGQLYYNDLRFGLMSLDADEAQFAFSYKLIPKDGELLVEENPKLKRDAKKLLLALWVRMWGI